MTRRRRSTLQLCLATSCIVPVFSVTASETVTYAYDARGRLIQVSRSGTVNDGIAASYSYDKADNRTNVTVSGPGFSVSDVAVAEGGVLVFTVTRSGGTSSSHGVSYATSDGTAIAGSDYTAATGTLTFAAGVSTQTVSVPTIDDTAVEGAETVTLTLSNPTGGASISDATGIGTINDNDVPPPSFAVSDVSVTEAQAAVFTVTKTGATSSSFSVNYATANGTAVAGTNYTATSGTLTFTAGETSKTVSVQTLNDGSIQASKSFNLNLSAATGGATISDGAGVATVAEIGELILYAGQSSWSPDGRFQLVMQTDGNLVLYGPDGAMWWTGTNGGADRRMVMQGDGNLVVYNGANQALWASTTYGNPGSRLAVQNDGNLVIYNSANAPIWATNTIYQPPSFSINDVTVTEGGNLSFTVTRSKATSATYSVNFGTANGTAAAGSDYYGGSGTLTFAPAESSKTITVTSIDDTAVESAETLTVNLSGATGGAVIGDSQGIGTINDNDVPPPSFSVNDASAAEGFNLVFTITKTGSTSNSYSVSYATANVTAFGGADYLVTSGTVTFAPTETSKTVYVLAGNDEEYEGNETFTLNLSNPTGGATIGDGQGLGTIFDVPPPDPGVCYDEGGRLIPCP